MKLVLNKKYSLLAMAFMGFGVTQLYQNCGPLPMEGFAVLSSAEPPVGHEQGLENHPVINPSKLLPTKANHVVSKAYVSAIFKEIFTSTAFPVAGADSLIEKWAFYKGAQFGGNCNIYTGYSNKDCDGSLANTNLDIYSEDNTVRESFRLQLCDNFLGSNNGVHAALEKIRLTSSSPLNAANIRLAYGLFFRNDPPETAIINSLIDLDVALVAAKEAPVNRWRAVLSQVCELPTWQIF